MRVRTIVLVVALGPAGLAAPHRTARAQGGEVEIPKQPRACFFPGPHPKCSSFFITEVGLGAGARYHDDGDVGTAQMFWELGWMVNRADQSAIGASIVLASDLDRVRYAIKLRQRWWVADVIAVDVAPGIGFDRITDGLSERKRLAFTAHAGVSLYDYLGIYVQLDADARWNRPDHGTAVLGGVRLGSWPGAIVGYVLPAALALGSNLGDGEI